MRSLVKGYGDTHERGRGQVRQARRAAPAPARARRNAGAALEALIKAALADEGGQALDKAIADLGPRRCGNRRPASASARMPSDSYWRICVGAMSGS